MWATWSTSILCPSADAVAGKIMGDPNPTIWDTIVMGALGLIGIILVLPIILVVFVAEKCLDIKDYIVRLVEKLFNISRNK